MTWSSEELHKGHNFAPNLTSPPLPPPFALLTASLEQEVREVADTDSEVVVDFILLLFVCFCPGPGQPGTESVTCCWFMVKNVMVMVDLDICAGCTRDEPMSWPRGVRPGGQVLCGQTVG